MPDGDVISRRVQFAWRPAYEGIQAQQKPGLVAPRIAKGVASTLRAFHGAPSLALAAELVQQARTGSISPREAFAAARSLPCENSKMRAIMARVVGRCIGEPPRDIDCTHDVAVSLVHEIANVGVLGQAVPSLVADGVAPEEAAHRYVEECRQAAEPDLVRLADQLVLQPSGDHFRAPPHRRARKTTSEMLDESIL